MLEVFLAALVSNTIDDTQVRESKLENAGLSSMHKPW